jgi:Leucine-rich repeat (LRR) protein
MNYSFTVLIDNDINQITLEKCMKLLNIDFECNIIDDEPIYEFTIDEKYKNLINLIIDNNNITVLKFLSKYN